jgi:hypothetical protein
MRSPGRPPVARGEHRQRFWKAIALGLSSEDAAVVWGVSQAVGTRWFRERGGMPSISLAPLSGRYLSFGEREEIAVLKAQGCGVRQLARRVGRSPSTISRELRRNAATRGGLLEYRATTARWHDRTAGRGVLAPPPDRSQGADRRGRHPRAGVGPRALLHPQPATRPRARASAASTERAARLARCLAWHAGRGAGGSRRLAVLAARRANRRARVGPAT